MRGIPSIHLPINCLLYINYLWHLLQKFGTVVFFKLTPKFVKLLTPSLIFEFLSLVEPLFLVTYTISYSFPSLQHYQILFYKNFYTVVRILGLNRYIYIYILYLILRLCLYFLRENEDKVKNKFHASIQICVSHNLT